MWREAHQSDTHGLLPQTLLSLILGEEGWLLFEKEQNLSGSAFLSLLFFRICLPEERMHSS